MSAVSHAFGGQTHPIPLEKILPTRLTGKNAAHTAKFNVILSSIRELGIIEPLVVYPEKAKNGKNGYYLLLDGHLRLEALKQLGGSEAICLIATDDEGFTYNRQVNRLSAVQEHRMILAAINRGVLPERIAKVLSVNVDRIREKQRLLEGIAPEVVEMFKDRMVGQRVFSILRKMKPLRQIESAEMMISANRFSASYAEMILVATRPELMANAKKPKRSDCLSPEDIVRMERELERLHSDYQTVEDTMGDTMLVLVVAKGHIARLLRNPAIADHLGRFHADLLDGLRSVMEAVTMDARTLERE